MFKYKKYAIIVVEVENILLNVLVNNMVEDRVYCESNTYVGNLEGFDFIDIIEKIEEGRYASC